MPVPLQIGLLVFPKLTQVGSPGTELEFAL